MLCIGGKMPAVGRVCLLRPEATGCLYSSAAKIGRHKLRSASLPAYFRIRCKYSAKNTILYSVSLYLSDMTGGGRCRQEEQRQLSHLSSVASCAPRGRASLIERNCLIVGSMILLSRYVYVHLRERERQFVFAKLFIYTFVHVEQHVPIVVRFHPCAY